MRVLHIHSLNKAVPAGISRTYTRWMISICAYVKRKSARVLRNQLYEMSCFDEWLLITRCYRVSVMSRLVHRIQP